jgi:hypothetical protein
VLYLFHYPEHYELFDRSMEPGGIFWVMYALSISPAVWAPGAHWLHVPVEGEHVSAIA